MDFMSLLRGNSVFHDLQHCSKFQVGTFRDALHLGHSLSRELKPKAVSVRGVGLSQCAHLQPLSLGAQLILSSGSF